MRWFRWPFMLKSDHETVRLENYTLRDALREANNEVRRYRLLLADMQVNDDTLTKVLKAKERAKSS